VIGTSSGAGEEAGGKREKGKEEGRRGDVLTDNRWG
jgi:hypothetical protein